MKNLNNLINLITITIITHIHLLYLPYISSQIHTSIYITSTEPRYGSTVTTADINNDHINSELIVGAYRAQSGQGAVFIYLQQDGFASTYVRVDGFSNDGAFGRCVTQYNSGLVSDNTTYLITSSPNEDNTGSIYVLAFDTGLNLQTYSKISQVDMTYTLDSLGRSCVGWDDIDSDGVNDVIVGYPSYAVRSGTVMVLLMEEGRGLKSYVMLETLTTLLGLESRDNLGTSIDGVDVNDDSVNDIIVGGEIREQDENWVNSGAIWILFMGQSVEIVTYSKITDLSENFVDLDDSARFGSSVKGIVDQDSDGVNDVIVGAERMNTVYVLYMMTTGVVKTYFAIGVTDLPLTTTLATFPEFGAGVSAYDEDVNDDGFIDIVVGADNEDALQVFTISFGFMTPTMAPTMQPTITPYPTSAPTQRPTIAPTLSPTYFPTRMPIPPTRTPTSSPTYFPTQMPTSTPTLHPTPPPIQYAIVNDNGSRFVTSLEFWVPALLLVVIFINVWKRNVQYLKDPHAPLHVLEIERRARNNNAVTPAARAIREARLRDIEMGVMDVGYDDEEIEEFERRRSSFGGVNRPSLGNIGSEEKEENKVEENKIEEKNEEGEENRIEEKDEEEKKEEVEQKEDKEIYNELEHKSDSMIYEIKEDEDEDIISESKDMYIDENKASKEEVKNKLSKDERKDNEIEILKPDVKTKKRKKRRKKKKKAVTSDDSDDSDESLDKLVKSPRSKSWKKFRTSSNNIEKLEKQDAFNNEDGELDDKFKKSTPKRRFKLNVISKSKMDYKGSKVHRNVERMLRATSIEGEDDDLYDFKEIDYPGNEMKSFEEKKSSSNAIQSDDSDSKSSSASDSDDEVFRLF